MSLLIALVSASAYAASVSSDTNHDPAPKAVRVAHTSGDAAKTGVGAASMLKNVKTVEASMKNVAVTAVEKAEVSAVTNAAGDIVRNLVAYGPAVGTVGQIRCGSSSGPLVCFPGWTGGHDGNDLSSCSDTPLDSCGPTSNWWIDTSNLEDVETSVCGGKFKIGDAVFANVDNPSSATDLTAGAIGQIYCSTDSNPPIGVNWGPSYTGGHDGNTGFCSATNMPLSGATSNWYVACDEIVALGTM